MSTAVLVADNITGFPGVASLYRIDPPMKGTDHVVLFYQPPLFHQQGQLNVVLATDTGAVFGNDVRPQQGSYVTSEPNHSLALMIAGGYLIVESEPETPVDIIVQEPPAPIPDPEQDNTTGADA